MAYTESEDVKKWREQMDLNTKEKPADYTSKWQPQIDSTMDSILNRKDFQYDVNSDALYNQYKDRYVNLGQQAMMDTMGQAAALTGGYGNSNAQMVGQQAYQGYLQGLTDKIPELYQMAYNRYNQQGQDLYQKYGLLNTQEQAALDRWNADYNRWLAERDWMAGRYDTERGYDYGQYRDTVADQQWQAQFDEDLRRWNLQNAPSGGGGGGGGSGGSRGSGTNTDQEIVEDNLNTYAGSGSYSETVQGSMAQIRAAQKAGMISTSQAQDLVKKYVSSKR